MHILAMGDNLASSLAQIGVGVKEPSQGYAISKREQYQNSPYADKMTYGPLDHPILWQ